MQSKTRCIISHVNGLYLNRRGDGLTSDMDAGIRFKDEAEASEWLLNSMYAPKDTDNYSYVPVEITIRRKEVEHERNDNEHLSKVD